MQYSLSRNQINIRGQGNAVRGKQIREISCGNVTSPTLIYIIAFNDPFIDALSTVSRANLLMQLGTREIKVYPFISQFSTVMFSYRKEK